jgi:hypothetical protein
MKVIDDIMLPLRIVKGLNKGEALNKVLKFYKLLDWRSMLINILFNSVEDNNRELQ